MRTADIFVSSWNMGGVDRESCTPAAADGPAALSALQMVIPLWIPRGYDLYVRAPCLSVSLSLSVNGWTDGPPRVLPFLSHPSLSADRTPTPSLTHSLTHAHTNQCINPQVIGVQECQILKELREAVLEHLGGPEHYTLFGKDIGSEMIHGRIATTLFVRTPDVAQGYFHMHRGVVDRVAAGAWRGVTRCGACGRHGRAKAPQPLPPPSSVSFHAHPSDLALRPSSTGVSLGPLGRAENKGMVGLSCKYGDATLAIISAHFASDKHGRNKVAKRNAVSLALLGG